MQFERERRALREGVLLWPAPELGTIVITGADRCTWLNAMATCDLSKLAPGGGAYGLCTAKNGKILAEFWLLAEADRLLFATHRARLPLLLEHFDRHIMMEDAEVSDATETLAFMLLLGPGAGKAARALASQPGAAGASVSWSERAGAVVAVERARMDEALKLLAQSAGDAFAVAGEAAFEALRIEEGIPRFGVDFSDQNYPQEASLERFAVSFQKGCYLGQEAVFMLEVRGHAKKRLVRLSIEGEGAPAPGTPLFVRDESGAQENVGTITSAAALEGGAVALGYVKYKQARAGVALWIAEGERAARIAYAPPMKEG